MLPARHIVAALSLVAVLHVPGLLGPLVFDDTHAVVQNTAIRDLANIPAFFVDPDLFSATAGRMYRPLVLTTLAVDHALGGGAPWAFKLGNLLQHLAVCLLLCLALPPLFRRAGLSARTVNRASCIGVLLFGVHPLHVESLCLVSSRSEVLAALGFLLALRGWLVSGERGRPWAQGGWLAAGTAIACLSKETGVLVPPVVLLTELLLPAGGRRPRLLELQHWVPRLAPAIPAVLSYLILRKALFGVATASLRTLSTGGDPYAGGTRDLATQLEAMAFFLPKAVSLWLLPLPLSLDHTQFFGLGFLALPTLAGTGFVLGLVLLGLLVRRSRPLLTLAILGSLMFAAPWILVPLNVPLAEHRLYLPVLLWTVPLAAWLARREWRARSAALPVAATLVLLLGARSLVQQRAWLTLRGIWEATLVWNPSSFRAWSGLGDAALEAGELWQACRNLEKARSIYPRYQAAAQNLCEVRVRLLAQATTRAFAARTVAIVERYTEERWKDPFARLLAARARMGHYRFSNDPDDLRFGQSWALSCLAMVDPKMLVYRTAAEVLRHGGAYDEALALFDAAEQRGLVNDEFLAHKAELLIEAGGLVEANAIVAGLAARQPFDPLILGTRARLHAAADRPGPWREVTRVLAGLGYDVSSLPRPRSLTGATPK